MLRTHLPAEAQLTGPSPIANRPERAELKATLRAFWRTETRLILAPA